MNIQIKQALENLFQKHRIVFWYDEKQEFGQDFEELTLDDVTKLEIKNNEFKLKYQILREQRDQKFLLYKNEARPKEYIDNWLLDVELYSGDFRTDQVAIWLSELGLGFEFGEVVQEHEAFFTPTRLEKLKKVITKEDTPRSLRFKMIGILCSSDARVDTILESLLAENAKGKEDKYKLLVRCHLDRYLWESIERNYGYSSENVSIKDFVITLFKDIYFGHFEDTKTLNSDALVFMNRWKDSRKNQTSFEMHSASCEETLAIEDDLYNRDFRELIELDFFDIIDKKIISDMVKAVSDRKVSSGDITLWVRARRQSHWYETYADIYQAIDYAAKFIATLDKTVLNVESLESGVQLYSNNWFNIDKLYRKYIYHMQASAQPTLLDKLTTTIENLYVNNYLLKLSDTWQTHIDKMDKWMIPSYPMQRDFYAKYVEPILDKNGKIYVIISDALRYEVGDELASIIRQEDMFEATIEPAISMLPSYTQLGMASLLPNKTIEFSGDEQATVIVDGINARSTNREKILQGYVPKSRTIKAKTLMNMTKDGDGGTRALVRDNNVVYIYHDVIDNAGKLKTEDTVSKAAEDCLAELKQIIRKLTSANATNIIVTADHGFIYQNKTIEESDYLGTSASGEEILYEDRRFILGRNLHEEPSFKKFTSGQLGLEGDIEALLPKSINRLKKSGSSSKFVHGGATLQEIVIPVIQIHKKRKSDTAHVEIDIIRGSSSVISSGQLSVTFYQKDAVTDKLLPRTLKAGIYTLDGVLISDSHTLTFDLTSDNPREREMKVRFLLSQNSDDSNGKEVVLKLEEQVDKTSHFREYATMVYQMRRSFKSDFDF
jgi:uncharacterized protein (TIGR02687 family)